MEGKEEGKRKEGGREEGRKGRREIMEDLPKKTTFLNWNHLISPSSDHLKIQFNLLFRST